MRASFRFLVPFEKQWEWGAVRECKSLCGPHSDSWSLLKSSGNGVQLGGCKSLCGPHSDSWSLLKSSGNGVQVTVWASFRFLVPFEKQWEWGAVRGGVSHCAGLIQIPGPF